MGTGRQTYLLKRITFACQAMFQERLHQLVRKRVSEWYIEARGEQGSELRPAKTELC